MRRSKMRLLARELFFSVCYIFYIYYTSAGNSLRKTPDCDLDLSECTSEENLTPEIGEQLERIHEERSLSEDLEDVDIFTNSKIARKVTSGHAEQTTRF